MQYSRNTARRMLEYQNRINTAAASATAGDKYMNTKNGYVSAATHSQDMVGCGSISNQPLSLAMAYVPFQEFRDLNEPDEALAAGTLFRELDKPFYGQRRKMG